MSPLADIPASLIESPDEDQFAAWLDQFHLPGHIKRDIIRKWEAVTGVTLSASKFADIINGAD